MKSRERRDDEAVLIVQALMLFAGVAVVVGVVGWSCLVVLQQLTPVGDDLLPLLQYVAFVTAALASVRYVHRRR